MDKYSKMMKELGKKISDFTVSNIQMPALYDYTSIVDSIHSMEIEPIEFPGNVTNELLLEQLELFREQNKVLVDTLKQAKSNQEILQKQYELQLQINKDNENQIKRNRAFTIISLIIAVVSIAVNFFI